MEKVLEEEEEEQQQQQDEDEEDVCLICFASNRVTH
jgi:hypothetical protein